MANKTVTSSEYEEAIANKMKAAGLTANDIRGANAISSDPNVKNIISKNSAFKGLGSSL